LKRCVTGAGQKPGYALNVIFTGTVKVTALISGMRKKTNRPSVTSTNYTDRKRKNKKEAHQMMRL